MDVTVKVRKLSPRIGADFPEPHYASPGAAAMDLIACVDEPVILRPHTPVLVPCGIAIALPSPEYAALVYARSGLASKHGVALANGVGVIDSDYRGEVKVPLINQTETEYTVYPGDRIAQLMIAPVLRASISFVTELDETQRGEGGFGSTGR